jgi:hypothetical protein
VPLPTPTPPPPPPPPPPHGSFKVNFDVAVRPNFSVASAILSSHNGWILAARTQQLPPSFGEASAALLAVRLATSYSCPSIHVEGDTLLTILAINQGHLFLDWPCAPVIADCRQQLSFFSSWTTSKVSRCANSRTHLVAK